MPTQNGCLVRLARSEDIEMLVTFNAAMAFETEGRTLDRELLRRGTLAVLQSPAKGFYVVTEGPQTGGTAIVGQLMVTYEWSDWRNGAFWWIQSVYVDPAWRRRGLYRRMHEYVLERARAQGDVCGIRLYVETNNSRAQTVYQRVGLAPSSYRVFEQDFVFQGRARQSSGEKG